MHDHFIKEKRMKKINLILLSVILSSITLLFSACEGETVASTEDKKDLKPVGMLSTITEDKQITLIFQSTNSESDFMGFRVWCKEGEAPQALANSKPFDLGAETNKTLVDQFQIVEPTANEGIQVTISNSKGVAVTAPFQTYPLKTCNGKALENGTAYTFFVTAVNNDGTNGQNSWSSNIVSDVPASRIATAKEITVEEGSNDAYKAVPLNLLAESADKLELTKVTTDGTDCNATTADKGHLHVMFKSDRLWFKGIYGTAILTTKNQDVNELNDEAIKFDESIYLGCGKQLAVYPEKVYYFAVKIGENKYNYGKIEVVSVDATAGKITLNIVLQTEENELRFLL